MKTKTEKKTAPTIIVVFGGTGDLSRRKLVPAFYNLFLDGWMPEKLAIYGLGRSELNSESFQEGMHDALSEFSRSGVPDPESWTKFKESLRYIQSDINDEKSYKELLNEMGS